MDKSSADVVDITGRKKREEFKVDGRTFYRLPNGDLREVADPAAHARRQIAAIDAGYTITGIRLSDPKSDHATGVVVTLDAALAKEVVAVIRKGLAESVK